MRFRPRFGSTLKRLVPGVGVERWLLLLFGGITIVSLGVGYLLVGVYRTWTFPSVFYYLTLQFIPRAWRGLPFGLAGVAAVTIAVLQLNRSLLSAFRAPGQSSLADIIYNHRQRGRRPRVAGIGGGTGLSALLRGLKEHTDSITTIVTVADDRGSSGRLRRGLGLLPDGTIPLWKTSFYKHRCVPRASGVLPQDIREAAPCLWGKSNIRAWEVGKE